MEGYLEMTEQTGNTPEEPEQETETTPTPDENANEGQEKQPEEPAEKDQSGQDEKPSGENTGSEASEKHEENHEIYIVPGQNEDTAHTLDDIKGMLESISDSCQYFKEIMETSKEFWEAYTESQNIHYEDFLASLEAFSYYLEESTETDKTMLMMFDNVQTSVPLSSHYDTVLGFVVLPGPDALEYYYSDSYIFMEYTGVDAVSYSDNQNMQHLYGYTVSLNKEDWTAASDGCMVETANLEQYEEYITAPEQEAEEKEAAADKLFTYLEDLNTMLSDKTDTDREYYQSVSDYQEEMLELQAVETGSTLILCVAVFIILAEVTFFEIFRRFK